MIFMMIINCKNPLVSMSYIKIFQPCKGLYYKHFINTLTLAARGSTRCRRQILKTEVDPRTARVKKNYNGHRPIT